MIQGDRQHMGLCVNRGYVRRSRAGEKANKPNRGTVYCARWRCGSEQHMAARTDGRTRGVAPLRNQPDGKQTDRNCDTTESNAEQSIMRGRPQEQTHYERWNPAVCCCSSTTEQAQAAVRLIYKGRLPNRYRRRAAGLNPAGSSRKQSIPPYCDD